MCGLNRVLKEDQIMVKRYFLTTCGQLAPLTNGEYVLASDYDKLEAALQRIMRGLDCSEQSYEYAEEALGSSVSNEVPPK